MYGLESIDKLLNSLNPDTLIARQMLSVRVAQVLQRACQSKRLHIDFQRAVHVECASQGIIINTTTPTIANRLKQIQPSLEKYLFDSGLNLPILGIKAGKILPLPDLENYPEIKPNRVSNYKEDKVWKPYRRDKETFVRYWAIPGMEGYMHRLGGLEKDYDTSAISTDPANHQKMVKTRQAKIDKIADFIPEVEVIGDEDADLLIVGWGGTYGHLYEAMEIMHEQNKKVALAHFRFINPLPKNTAAVLSKYKKVVVAEQNNGQFANYLRSKVDGFTPYKFDRIKGQPFIVARLVEEFTKILEA